MLFLRHSESIHVISHWPSGNYIIEYLDILSYGLEEKTLRKASEMEKHNTAINTESQL